MSVFEMSPAWLRMDGLHMQGVTAIGYLQDLFKDDSELMMFLTRFGDPRIAFLVYFPLTYFCRPTSGIKVMWTASLAEWLNSVFKWLLFGHRPYWWINTSGLYNGTEIPALSQYRLTCETGPGSPSGHVMVPGAVWYVMISELLAHGVKQGNARKILGVVLWLLYALFLGVIGVTRCYLSAHFPHQIIGGAIAGFFLGKFCHRIRPENKFLLSYVSVSILQLVVGAAIYWSLGQLSLDVMWSLPLAQRWCAKPSWVHMDTTPFFCYTRDASALLGAGVALYYLRSRNMQHTRDLPRSLIFKLTGIVLSLVTIQLLEQIPLPVSPPWRFYCLAFLRCFTLPWTVIVLMWKICESMFAREGKVKVK